MLAYETMDGSNDGHLHGTLTIKIIEAKDLPDTDTNFWNIRSKDLTDPFVRGDFGTEMLFQTKHIDDELNPHWGETHHARINDSAKCLVISVLDKNFIFPSFVGYVSFSTEDILKEEIIGGPEGDWFPLFNNGKQQGKIKLSIQFTPKDPSEDEFHLLHGRIRICINEARDLPDMDKTLLCKDVTDPFVHGGIGEARLFKTDHKDNQLNPIWNESFNVHVCHYAKTLDIIVEDKDWNDNEFVGSVSFSTKKLSKEKLIGGPKGDWFPIWKDGKSCGEIKLSMKFTSKDALEDEKGLEVKDAYFPMRENCRFTLYQEAECPPEGLPVFEGVTFPDGSPYQPARCWYDIYQAIKDAEKFIYIAGWSVYTEIEFVRGQDDPDKLSNVGRLLKAKADEGVKVILMVWDDKKSDDLNVLFPNGEMMTHAENTRNYFEGTKVNCVLVGRTKTFGLKSDQVASSLYSHHQKSVTCDVEDTDTGLRRVVSFIGGLDITHGRYDTPEFPLFKSLTNGNVHYYDFHGSNCPGATRETGPRQPWHDNHARVEGIAAIDIKQNFEDRIMKQALEVSESLYNIDEDEFVAIDSLPIVPNYEGGRWSLQLFRSISSDSCVFDRLRRDCLKGKGDRLVDNSIQRCMIQQIRNAQNFIYMETQSFLGSAFQWESEDDDHLTLAHNLIPVEISNKILEKIKQGKMFTAYIVISMFPEGDPTTAPLQEILFWQYRTIQSMYRSVAEALKETNFGARPEDFLKFFCLGKRESKEEVPDLQAPDEGSLPARIRETLRQPVYVHSKMTIIDDQYILIGSANINERSLSGERDTEIAMGGFQNKHTVALEGNPRGDVHTYRMALWASHFGGHQDAFDNPNTAECRGKVTQISEQFWQDYISDDPQHCDVHMLPYPIDVDPDSGNVTSLDAPWDCFPDTNAKVLGQKSVFCAYPVKLTT